MVAFVPSALASTVRPGAFTASKCTVTGVRPAASRRVATKMVAAPPLSATALAMLPSLPLSANMAVNFPGYLAIILGVSIPCAFLVILYIQGESRKAGEKSGRGGGDDE